MTAAVASSRDAEDDERFQPARRALRPVGRPAAATTDTVWFARLAHRASGGAPEHSVVVVNSDRFPTGTPVDLSGQDSRGRRPAGWLVDVRYRACDGHVLRIEVAETVATPAPPLWFAEICHATSNVPTVSLLAFAGTGPAAG